MSSFDYSGKVVSPAYAASLIKSGDRILMPHASALPRLFLNALMERKNELRHVQLNHTRTDGALPLYLAEDCRESFFLNAFMIGKDSRKAMLEGRADYIPCGYLDQARFIRRGTYSPDYCVLHVTPPDEKGYCSLGVCASYLVAAIGNVPNIIAEINPNMPHTFGAKVHVDDIQYIIEADYVLPEARIMLPGETESRIGQHIASLIDDGSTIQTGIGGIPNAVFASLRNHKDLAVHTEMFSDSVVDLVQAGTVTGKKRGYHPGKITATFVMGTQKLFDFVNWNPDVEIVGVEETNSPSIIAQNNKFVAINSAVEVDVTGQICAESVGTRQLSGVGGQLDFALGVRASSDGKFIIAMPSTALGGTRSKIVPMLETGAAVTTPRTLVDYIVTEYGSVCLRGKSLSQRAREIIKIAHPDFREELELKTVERKDIHFRSWD